MKRIFIWTLCLLLAVLPLAACDTAGTPAPDAETEQTSPGGERAWQQQSGAEPADQGSGNGGGLDIPASPLPDSDTFIERYNAAAAELGAWPIDREDTRALSWNSTEGLITIDAGFSYEIPTGAIMFDPYYVRIMARMPEDMEPVYLVYGAAVSACTGLSAQESLEAVQDMIAHTEDDTWTNGYEVTLGEMMQQGLEIDYELGRSTGISQLFINKDGLQTSNQVFG